MNGPEASNALPPHLNPENKKEHEALNASVESLESDSPEKMAEKKLRDIETSLTESNATSSDIKQQLKKNYPSKLEEKFEFTESEADFSDVTSAKLQNQAKENLQAEELQHSEKFIRQAKSDELAKLDAITLNEIKTEKWDSLSEKEKNKIINAERKKQKKVEKTNYITENVNELVTEIWPKQPEKQLELKKMLAQWQSTEDGTGLTGFIRAYRRAELAQSRGSNKEMQSFKNQLFQSGLSKTNVDKLLRHLSNKNRWDKYLKRLEEENLIISGLREDAKNGTNHTDEWLAEVERVREEEGEEAAQKAFKEGFAEMAEDNEELQKVQEFYEKQDEFNKEYNQMKESAQKQKSKAEITQELQENSPNYAKLPTNARDAVVNMSQKGGNTDIASRLLQGEVQVQQDHLLGEVEDVVVRIRLEDGSLAIVGEHANEKQNRYDYPVDPPSVPNFNQVRLHMMVEQNRMDYFTHNQDIVNGIAQGITRKNPEGEALLNGEETRVFHNFMHILFGNNDIEAGEEKIVLEECGILREGTKEVDPSQMERYRRALIKYVPDLLRSDRRTDDPVDVSRADLLTLAEMWKEDRYALPGSLEDLKSRTGERLSQRERSA